MNIKTFVIDQKLNYQEHYCNNEYVNKYYEIENTGVAMHLTTIPDACLDFQFAHLDGKNIISASGSFLHSAASPSSKYSWCFGVKFNPGKYPLLVHDVMDKLVGEHIIIDDCPFLDAMATKIHNASSFQERAKIFEERFPFENQFSASNSLVNAIIEYILNAHGNINIVTMAKKFQYNQRYMSRVFLNATGLTMKKYTTIIRIQTALRYLQEDRVDEVYEKLGYYDQSYFIKDFKNHTSMTPRQYCKKTGIVIV
jgi:AraC-like DNA-binding protein